MEKVIKGTIFKSSDKKLNISDVMCSSSKKSNFVDNTIKLAKKLGYKVTIKQNYTQRLQIYYRFNVIYLLLWLVLYLKIKI